MKKLLILVVAVALVVWVVSWFRTPAAVATAASHQWPGTLGPLDSVAARFPPLEANPASARLKSLAAALPKNEAVEEFVSREISRPELTIGTPPALPDVSAIRDLLLREPIVWNRGAGVGDVGSTETTALRAEQMAIARTLVADALVKARTNDPAAWENLRAVWNLARALDPYPEMMIQTADFSMARMVNAVAWKMPLPPPAWLADLQARDYVPRLLASFQYQVASYWQGSAQMFPTKFLADNVEGDRRIAETLSAETRCDVTAPMNSLGTDLSFVWRRAFRYRAEREATANALRVRERKPVETASRCSDGTWSFDRDTLRFSKEIATTAPDRPMPLVLSVK